MDPATSPFDLDERKQRILGAIVTDYIATAEPVGSQILVERYSLGVKSATIRNEMAELSGLGLLRQPHTSAGRVPSDRGYRFYVSHLMVIAPIGEGEALRTRQELDRVSSEMEAVLRRTCALLARMTRLPALATPPDADETQVRQIFLAPSSDKLLLVVVLSNGRTEHGLLTGPDLRATDALQLVNALNERFAGIDLATVRALDPARELPPVEIGALAPIWQRVTSELVQIARGLAEDSAIYVEGAESVLEQPEFRDVERLGHFLTLLQQRAALQEILDAAPESGIRIGAELGRPALSDLAVVTSPYFVGSRERGSLGVVGPSRMDYARTTAAVRFMADAVSELLTRLAFAG